MNVNDEHSPGRPWIHLILQGKGGVGKSLLAALMAQHRTDRGRVPLCIDTDPVNQTFQRFAALNVRSLDMIGPDRQVNQTAFDHMIDLIFEHPNEEVIVDNGAACFLPLSAYLIENHVLEFLSSNGRPMMIHSVITGGQACLDTVEGLDHILRTFDFDRFHDDLACVVWLNPFFGAVTHRGQPFETMPTYTDNRDRITTCLRLNRNDGLYSDTARDMLNAYATFQEIEDGNAANLSKPFSIMAKQRANVIRKEFYAQMDHLFHDVLKEGLHQETPAASQPPAKPAPSDDS